ncbi:SDR family oxidoreductase [Salicibibacter halophilus]|uniref:SDR family oxidoreductase n=1 Tax=Salicibibacter halophilus TaxID=2502791 RepID=A0A514LER4_9BACI|nr:SDR family oxidoreductase [Salicibibacter halophilus]
MKGQVIVITGASSGIGEATAISLAKKGAKIVLGARRKERLEDIAGNITKMGGQAVFYQTDVTSRSDVEGLAAFTIEKFGQIDVWINNAGIMQLSFLDKLKVDEWDRMIDVNVKGVLYGIAADLPVMEKEKGGHIINISSVAGRRVGIAGSVYSGTKFAVRAITEGLRQELSPRFNIRTTLISPGSVETELRETISDKDALKMLNEREIESRLQPEDIVNAIVYTIQQPDYASVNEVIIHPTTQRG